MPTPEGAPKLTVAMPVHNGEAYVAEAIESLLAQSFGDFELLIVDDGSTDGSAEVVEAIAARDPRIRFFQRENRGVPRAVNELIEMARGDYFTRMDADDVSLPGRLERQVAWLDAHPEIDVLGGHALYADGEGRPIFVPGLPLDHEGIDAMNLAGRVAFIQSSVMMRTALLRQVGGYDTDYWFAQDLDLWLRMAEHGRLANLEDVVLRYRFTDTGLSGSKVKEQSAMAERACRAAWARRGLPPQQMVKGHWRPTQERGSRRDYAIKWGWQAWKAGNRATARHYFLKALRLDPLSRRAWRGAAISALRGPGDRGNWR